MASHYDGDEGIGSGVKGSGGTDVGGVQGSSSIGEKTFDLGLRDELSGKARVVTARGTEDGFVLRIDGKAEWESILDELESMLGGRQRFFEGGEVLIEWLDRLPTKEQSKDLGQVLKARYGIGVTTRRKRILHSMTGVAGAGAATSGEEDLSSRTKRSGAAQTGADEGAPISSPAATIPLFDDMLDAGRSVLDAGRNSLRGNERNNSDSRAIELSNEVENQARPFGRDNDLEPFGGLDRNDNIRNEGVGIDSLRGLETTDLSSRYLSKVARILGNDILTDDEANAKVLFGTLRSGQRIETPFSLIVIGDVNPGADIIAGGDIAVLGSLRGTAHAAAYDDDSFDRVIIALQMQPMQLRIGSVISRGSDEASSGPEIARIDNRRIVVEPYNARGIGAKKKAAGW